MAAAAPAEANNRIIDNRPFPVALTKEQNEVLEVARNVDQSVQAYLREHPVSPWKIIQSSSSKFMVTAGIGSGVGYVGFKVAEKAAQAPPTAKVVSVAVGVLIAGGLLLKVLKKDEIRKVQLSSHYAEWKATAMENDVYSIFQNFIKDDERLNDLFCPITQDLILYPVKAKDDRTIFERQAIVAHIEGCHRRGIRDERTHPMRSSRITENQLEFVGDYHETVINRLREVLNEELIEAVREGLMAFRDTVSENDCNGKRVMYDYLVNKCNKGEISQAEFDQFKAQLFSRESREEK